MTQSKADTGRTVLYAPFAGQQRRFKLPLGKIAELERLCNAGIGAIMVRLVTHQFHARDIWETIRLGLEGGNESMSELEATATCMAYHDYPLMDFVSLASQILTAAVSGVPLEETEVDDTKKKNPETSQTSTQPVAH